jgi:hypothetical protein
VAVGGGFDTSIDGIYVSESFPADADTWTVRAQEHGFGTGSNWTVTAYVLCVPVPAPA